MHRIPSGIVRSTTTGQCIEFFDKVHVPSDHHWEINRIYLQPSTSRAVSPQASPQASPLASPLTSPQMCPTATVFQPKTQPIGPPGFDEIQSKVAPLGGDWNMASFPVAMAA
jgi:hypothetical protein